MARKHTPDQIVIRNLTVHAHIGVPDEERQTPQRLTVSLVMEPKLDFWAMNDDIRNTIDYAAVCEAVKTIAAARPRKLIETLAEEIASELLANFPIWRLTLELHKYILPDTEYVAVRIDRPVP